MPSRLVVKGRDEVELKPRSEGFSTRKVYPVSEIFTAPQGEGLYTGTLMTFIRLAGCNVGKPYPKEVYQPKVYGEPEDEPNGLPGFPIYTEECTTWDGRKFACDTDYRVKERLTAEEIISQVPKGVEHICITGGEPLLHNLIPLQEVWYERIGTQRGDIPSLHIETSGTKEIPREIRQCYFVWITVSPKFGCLPEVLENAKEVKLLVDENFDEEQAASLVKYVDSDESIIWLQPINGEHTINDNNMKRCLGIQERHPTWRISSQSHKSWGTR